MRQSTQIVNVDSAALDIFRVPELVGTKRNGGCEGMECQINAWEPKGWILGKWEGQDCLYEAEDWLFLLRSHVGAAVAKQLTLL